MAEVALELLLRQQERVLEELRLVRSDFGDFPIGDHPAAGRERAEPDRRGARPRSTARATEAASRAAAGLAGADVGRTGVSTWCCTSDDGRQRDIGKCEEFCVRAMY